MVRMAARLPEHNARLILQIHDEVVVCSLGYDDLFSVAINHNRCFCVLPLRSRPLFTRQMPCPSLSRIAWKTPSLGIFWLSPSLSSCLSPSYSLMLLFFPSSSSSQQIHWIHIGLVEGDCRSCVRIIGAGRGPLHELR